MDDNEYNLYALRIMLEMFGIESVFANNSESAVEIAKEPRCCAFKCILMDLNMPIMLSFQATKILNQKIRVGDIEPIDIIAVTANSQTEIQKKCLKSGFPSCL